MQRTDEQNDEERSSVPQEEIALYAYCIWQDEGCPHGRDIEHWFQAEAHLLAVARSPMPSVRTKEKLLSGKQTTKQQKRRIKK